MTRPVGTRFPDPSRAPKHGLVFVGGNLSPEMLLDAYDQGIFPWYSDGERVHWWSPDPRAIIDPEHLHISASLGRELRRARFEVTWNQAFSQVICGCAAGRADGTWIVAEMIDAYCGLHRLGHAHSIEAWHNGFLVGGLYGVRRGDAFMAESMFHTVTNASKVALVQAVRMLFQEGVRLFDVQFLTPHLESMGAYEIPRSDYLGRLRTAARNSAR